jgi:mRNA-degrading endonuclease HigB of HigAB toxin-antitoxin module
MIGIYLRCIVVFLSEKPETSEISIYNPEVRGSSPVLATDVGNDRYVFNIKGNKYRLVAMIFFNIRTVYIRFIGTHTEYDKIDCSTI